MGNFECNSIEDLVFSRSFRNWVLNRNSAESGFWDSWIAAHPDKRDLVNHSKAIIYALQLNWRQVSEEDIDQEITTILERLNDGSLNDLDDEALEGQENRRHNRRGNQRVDEYGTGREGSWSGTGQDKERTRMSRFAGVLTILSLLGLSTWFTYTHGRHQPVDALQSFLDAAKVTPVQEVTLPNDPARLIILPDGSSVRLERNSKLYYAADLSAGGPDGTSGAGGRVGPDGTGSAAGTHGVGGTDSTGGRQGGADGANGHSRNVFLTGEAFFDIKKNASRPFFVYTRHLVTKVLGTSFRVKAYPSDPITLVTVKTGKICVYRQDDYHAGANDRNEPGRNESGRKESGGVVVTPNQQLIYDQQAGQLNKTLIDKPEKLADSRDTAALVFDATPVSRVLETLHAAYGISILYDEEILSSCSLFATMGNESFYEKLNIICKAINASYEVIDGNVVVTARGCK